MSADVLVARAMLFVPVALAVLLLSAMLLVLFAGLRVMARDRSGGGPPGWMFQGLIGLSALLWIDLAGMDVGQFFALFTDGWAGIAALAGVFFVPWVGMQTVIKGMKTAKGSVDEIAGGGAPTIPPTPQRGG